ncbi:DEKNAAC105235 [Brettanomyces naardenensis]|uniref:DEKNAAC105235 n=1 Tax=Brettanomyces naardenensis TaxID=13370 RepID=A0A448YSQ1_BRENA|nr:DEKNAAC105235 [Brettanomyces naardenensis]
MDRKNNSHQMAEMVNSVIRNDESSKKTQGCEENWRSLETTKGMVTPSLGNLASGSETPRPRRIAFAELLTEPAHPLNIEIERANASVEEVGDTSTPKSSPLTVVSSTTATTATVTTTVFDDMKGFLEEGSENSGDSVFYSSPCDNKRQRRSESVTEDQFETFLAECFQAVDEYRALAKKTTLARHEIVNKVRKKVRQVEKSKKGTELQAWKQSCNEILDNINYR